MDTAGATADLISHLPGDITDNILLRLPLQEAVRTSILSKNWRYRWRTCPVLRFGCFSFSSALVASKSKSELLTIIHKVLSQHQGPIPLFMLDLPQLGSCPEIDHFISILSSKSVKQFFFFVGETHSIPSYIFSFLNMECLGLGKCVLRPPTDFPGFAKLSTLALLSVDLPDSFAETFVAKCPLLENLLLHECTNLDRINFNAPNLQRFNYRGSISSISFKNTPSLTDVSINYGDRTVPTLSWTPNTWIDTFCSLPSLKYLQLGPLFSQMLSEGIDLDIVARKLNCLKTLVLSLSFGSPLATRLTLSLIGRSPNLQKLVIDLTSPSEEGDGSAVQFSEYQESSDFSLQKLESIEMSSFRGLKSEMALVELLLAKSPMLETMRIYHLKEWWTREQFMALQEINQVPRASPRAKVISLEPRKKHMMHSQMSQGR